MEVSEFALNQYLDQKLDQLCRELEEIYYLKPSLFLVLCKAVDEVWKDALGEGGRHG